MSMLLDGGGGSARIRRVGIRERKRLFLLRRRDRRDSVGTGSFFCLIKKEVVPKLCSDCQCQDMPD